MKTFKHLLYLATILFSLIIIPWAHPQTNNDFFTRQKRNKDIKHVHLMHIDGARSDLFKRMLKAGQLPHFQFLLKRGKISYHTSTVDKSETMKVIQSYLTSKIDTKVVGWWQFDRTSYQYRNFWLNPIEVINYALGLEFPMFPTVYDYFAAHHKIQLAGFTLHRRGVPFDNYGRAYAEGGMAVKKHTYFDQAHATMKALQALLKRETQRIESSGGSIADLPLLTTSLLAPADEFGHLRGVYKPKRLFNFSTSCFSNREPYKYFFEIIENDSEATVFIKYRSKQRDILGHPKLAHFKSYHPGSDRICVQLPKLTEYNQSKGGHQIYKRKRYAQRDYALGLITVDIQLGNLINTLRSIDLSSGKPRYRNNIDRGIVNYLINGRSENTLFEHTLFIIFGDHGMAHTPKKMSDSSKDSNHLNFIEMLNRDLALATAGKRKSLKNWHGKDGNPILLGVDDKLLPRELSLPYKFIDQPYWNLSPEKKKIFQLKIKEAEEFSQNFIKVIMSVEGHLVANLKKSILKKFWWLLIFRDDIVEPRFYAAIEKGKKQGAEMIAQLYLKGDPEYLKAEQIALKTFYDQHVRLVYGGGARNNAELFLPQLISQEGQRKYQWNKRPSSGQILNYRPGNGKILLQTLFATPGVDLIFIRQNNGEITAERPLKGLMKITVLNPQGHKGIISVKRDPKTSELLFAYEVSHGHRDPLGYNSDRPRNRTEPATFATYNEWNDLSIAKEHYYHNVVAGMGSYLYSNNPSIGDVTITHLQNWNFGGNSGGHGGVHREEKLTLFMVSGPGITADESLMAQQRYKTDINGNVLISGENTHPTVLDVVPTIYQWLGVTDKDLKKFVQKDFQSFLEKWARQQQEQILNHLDQLEDEVERIGIGRPDFVSIKDPLMQILRFIPNEPVSFPKENFENYRMDGQPVIHER